MPMPCGQYWPGGSLIAAGEGVSLRRVRIGFSMMRLFQFCCRRRERLRRTFVGLCICVAHMILTTPSGIRNRV